MREPALAATVSQSVLKFGYEHLFVPHAAIHPDITKTIVTQEKLDMRHPVLAISLFLAYYTTFMLFWSTYSAVTSRVEASIDYTWRHCLQTREIFPDHQGPCRLGCAMGHSKGVYKLVCKLFPQHHAARSPKTLNHTAKKGLFVRQRA